MSDKQWFCMVGCTFNGVKQKQDIYIVKKPNGEFKSVNKEEFEKAERG